jgi:hypothetical protein
MPSRSVYQKYFEISNQELRTSAAQLLCVSLLPGGGRDSQCFVAKWFFTSLDDHHVDMDPFLDSDDLRFCGPSLN